jgi:hypothetical protein
MNYSRTGRALSFPAELILSNGNFNVLAEAHGIGAHALPMCGHLRLRYPLANRRDVCVWRQRVEG